jgi:hypothetical protein
MKLLVIIAVSAIVLFHHAKPSLARRAADDNSKKVIVEFHNIDADNGHAARGRDHPRRRHRERGNDQKDVFDQFLQSNPKLVQKILSIAAKDENHDDLFVRTNNGIAKKLNRSRFGGPRGRFKAGGSGELRIRKFNFNETHVEAPSSEEPNPGKLDLEEVGTEEDGTEEPNTEEPNFEEPSSEEPGSEEPNSEEP